MIKQPIVILGGNGMLGQDLAAAFRDAQPLVWDRAECDITNADEVARKLRTVKPQIILNAAAYNLVDAAETEPGRSLATQVNTMGPTILANIARMLHATLVHYSTDYVFDGRNKAGYRENDRPNPQSHYGVSKSHGEEAVLASGARAYVIRTCRLFGKPGNSDAAKKSFVDMMLQLAKEKSDLSIVDEEYASPTYTPDLASQTRFLLEHTHEPGVYHITNSGACTWYTFTKEIFRLAHIPVQLHAVSGNFYPRKAARPRYSQLLNTKLPALRSWQDALAAYLQL